jgi:hypothetical protein
VVTVREYAYNQAKDCLKKVNKNRLPGKKIKIGDFATDALVSAVKGMEAGQEVSPNAV